MCSEACCNIAAACYLGRINMKTAMVRIHKLLICAVFLTNIPGVCFAYGDSEKGTLYDRARKAKDKTLREMITSDGSFIAADLVELSRRSNAIIVGTPFNNMSQLANEGKSLETIYSVRVNRVFKGKIKPGHVIKVILPGGAYLFRDGTRVFLYPPNMALLKREQHYIFYLKSSPAGEHTLSNGAQGLFELDSSTNTMAPCSLLRNHPVVVKYKNMPINEFLLQVRRAAKTR